jgi:hypothetical protein
MDLLRIKHTYIVELKSSHAMMDDEICKLHELYNGKFYKEKSNGRLSLFNTQTALKLILEMNLSFTKSPDSDF